VRWEKEFWTGVSDRFSDTFVNQFKKTKIYNESFSFKNYKENLKSKIVYFNGKEWTVLHNQSHWPAKL